ncbi:hypothetical protein ACLOJK_033964 [Asimina triloba]
MGRKKIPIARIHSKTARTVTFTKRRQGLFKKASELSILCDVDVAIVTFSPAGRPFSFGHPSVDSLLARFGFGGPTPLVASSSSKPINGDYWWEAVDLGERADEVTLRRAKMALEELKENVHRRLATLSLPDPAKPVGFSASSSLVAWQWR